MGSSFLSEDQGNRYIQSFYLCHRYIKINIIMKIAICFACVVAMATAESWMAAPYTLVKRDADPQNRPSVGTRNNNPNTRFFTGNGALDAGLAGAAAGVAGQYITNQIFNPCRNRNRTTTEDKPTTESLVETPETSFLALLVVLLLLPLQMLLLEILVEDKRLLSICY